MYIGEYLFLPQTFSGLVSCVASDACYSHHRESAETCRNIHARLSRRRERIKRLLCALLSRKLLRGTWSFQATPEYTVESEVDVDVLSAKIVQKSKIPSTVLADGDVARALNIDDRASDGRSQVSPLSRWWHIHTKEWRFHPLD